MTDREELARLEAALARLDDADLDEVDPAEYSHLLARVVELREKLSRESGEARP